MVVCCLLKRGTKNAHRTKRISLFVLLTKFEYRGTSGAFSVLIVIEKSKCALNQLSNSHSVTEPQNQS